MGITASTWDTVLAALLDAAEAMGYTICNRPGWSSAATTMKVAGIDHSSIPLLRSPSSAITSVKHVFSSTSSETLDSTTYRTDANPRVETLYLDSSPIYSRVLQGIQGYDTAQVGTYGDIGPAGTPNRVVAYPYTEVVYTGGFATQGDVPSDLVYAANEVTKAMFLSRDTDPSMQSENHGNYSYVRKIIGNNLSLREFATELFAAWVRYPIGVHA